MFFIKLTLFWWVFIKANIGNIVMHSFLKSCFFQKIINFSSLWNYPKTWPTRNKINKQNLCIACILIKIKEIIKSMKKNPDIQNTYTLSRWQQKPGFNWHWTGNQALAEPPLYNCVFRCLNFNFTLRQVGTLSFLCMHPWTKLHCNHLFQGPCCKRQHVWILG